MLKPVLVGLFYAASTVVCLAQDAKIPQTTKSATPASGAAQPMTSAPVRPGSSVQHVVPVPTAPKQTSKTGGGAGGGSN